MKAQKNTCTNSKEAQLPSNDCCTGTYKDQKAKIITIWPNTRWHSKIYKLGLGELTQWSWAPEDLGQVTEPSRGTHNRVSKPRRLHLRVQRNPHGASFHRTSTRESSWYLHTITFGGLPQLYKRTTRPHHSTHTTSKSSSMLSHVIRALSISGDRLIELVLCSRVALVSWDIVCISFSLVRLCSSSMEYLSLLYIMHKLYKHPMCRLNMSKKHRSKKNWW
jgi:hypothetical protein